MSSGSRILTVRTAGLRTLACALMIAAAAPPGSPLALAQGAASREVSSADGPQSSWPVEFARGDLPFVAQHRNLTLELRGGSFLVRQGEETLRSVPAGALVAAVYDVAPYRPVVGYFASMGPWRPSLAYTEINFGLIPIALIEVVIPLVLAPIVKSQHFVTLIWKDRDQVRDVTFQVKGNDRAEILAAIQEGTGVVGRDAPAERARLRDDVKAAKRRSFILDLDREIYIADTYVDAGGHRAVVLERGAGDTELLVFKGRSHDHKEVVLGTPVRVTAAGTAAGEEVAVSYRDSPAGSTISELRTGDRIITLPEFIVPAPGEPQLVPGTHGRVVRIAAGQFATGTITRSEYGGQPAFLFKAIRTNFTFSFSSPSTNPYPIGDLYVSRGRVIFDPGDSRAARKRRVSLARSAITEIATGPMNNSTIIRLTTRGKTFSFRLRAPGRSPDAASPWSGNHGRTRLVETRLADFARLAIRDFDAAMRMFEGWVAGGSEE
ncbi:MAG: hypothetical protein ACREAA_07200 [Candidatus Polarisedimenticolia bacterium]